LIMRCRRNLEIILIVTFVAFQVTSIAWGVDQTSNSDRYMDQARGEMVKWLDQPVAGSSSPATQSASRSTETNGLWVLGATNWTQYAATPVGTSLEVVANVPTGGIGYIYKLFQNNNVSLEHRTYQFNPGKNEMGFKAEKVGRYMFYFVVNNQPSNVVIVDVSNQVASVSTPSLPFLL
jgi:hypothetical protein